MSTGIKAFLRRHEPLVILLSGVLILLVVWHPVFRNHFVMWDDDFNIYENPIIKNGSWLHFWQSPYMGFYIPVTYTVWFAVAHLFSQNDPLPFQILNLSFHFLNTVLIFAWLRLLMRKTFPAGKGETPFPPPWILYLISLIYLLHPMQVGAVAWHSGFRDLLSTTASLTCLLMLFASRTRKTWLVASLGFAIALLSKPASVYLPGLVLMLAFVMPAAERKRYQSWALVHLILAGVFVIVTRNIQSQFMIGLDAAPIWDRPFIIMDSYGFYVRQFFFGGPVSADYGRTPDRVISWGLWWETLPWFCAFLIFLGVIFYRYARAAWIFLMLWLVPLSPTSGLVHFNFQRISTVADHYIQPALPAFCFLILFILWRLRQNPKAERALLAVLVGGLLWGAVRTADRITAWRDSETLFHSMLKVTPFSHSANNYLGYFAYKRQDWVAAEGFFRNALASQPNSGIASGNLAYSYIKQGRYQEAHLAVKDFLKSPEFFRVNEVHRHVIAMNFLANSLALANIGRYPQALESVCRVFEFNPEPRDKTDATDTLKKLQGMLNPKDPQSVVCPAKLQ